jgi:CheY-like chemotaxis protein
VLVVEDELDTRRVLRKLLGEAGATVTLAESAEQAIKLLPESRPHILLSDVGMPDEDGYSLMRRVRELGYSAADLPAIALTAFVQKDDQRESQEAWFQAHLSKPVAPKQLVDEIHRIAVSP